VADVVQKRGESQLLHYFRVVDVALGKQALARKAGHVHGTKGVLKARVLCAWVDKVRACKLPYPAQSLKDGAVYDVPLGAGEPDGPVYRVGYLAFKIQVKMQKGRAELNFHYLADHL
jgi:hypothetical protein